MIFTDINMILLSDITVSEQLDSLALIPNKFAESLDMPASSSNSLWAVLLFTLLLNVICLVFQHLAAVRMSKIDVRNERKKEILKQRLVKEQELFIKIESLRKFQANQQYELLNSMEEINTMLRNNKLLYSSSISELAEEVLDYYKNVVVDFSCKKFETENDFMKRFYKAYENV